MTIRLLLIRIEVSRDCRILICAWVAPLMLQVFHLNLPRRLHVVVILVASALLLMLLLHAHGFALSHVLVLRSDTVELSRSTCCSCRTTFEIPRQLALDGLETPHLPLGLLALLVLLLDELFSLLLDGSLDLVHLAQVLRVVVLGHRFARQRCQQAADSRAVLGEATPTLDVHLLLARAMTNN